MMKKMLGRLAFVAAMTTLAMGPAQATDGPAFTIHFYTDASHTQVTGFARAACNPDPVAIMWWGYSTDYQEVTFVGQCIDGVLYYD